LSSLLFSGFIKQYVQRFGRSIEVTIKPLCQCHCIGILKTFLGQTKPPTYWRWTVPLNNAPMVPSANCRCGAEE